MATLTKQEAAAQVMIALDRPSAEEALALAAQLEGAGCWMKVGMELFYAAGPAVVRELKTRGFKVFLDLKLHDIPNTVRGGARSITRLGVDLFNIHAAGGHAMMAAAVEGVQEALEGGEAERAPILIAVTQLTSTSRQVLNQEIRIPGSVEETVVAYARLAQQAGLQGVVASPHEVAAVKEACSQSFITVTPGIRPQGAATGDQSRVMTPREAVTVGTDFLVIGRPITGAANPAEALDTIIKEMTA